MEEKARKTITTQENRKRIAFFLKLLLLLGLVYIRVEYSSWLEANTQWGGIVKALLFYLSANLLVSLARIISVYFYIRRKQLKNEENNVVLAINRIAALLNAAALVAAAFLLLDLSWEGFFTSFSLVAVATVLITKDYISNTINGLIIMVSDRISLNDYVKIGTHTGKVVDITLSNVHLLDDARHTIMIPNNTVFGADIINYTRKASSYVEVSFDMKPELLQNLTRMEDQLIQAMEPYDTLVKKNSYELLVEQIHTDKVTLQFRFALRTPRFEKQKELKHWVLREVAQWQIQGNRKEQEADAGHQASGGT